MILAGHGRIEAAKLLKLDRVPCVRLESMTSEQRKRAFILADNKVAANAGWDDDLLAKELKALSEAILDFDIETTGFSIAEIDSTSKASNPKNQGIRATTNCLRSTMLQSVATSATCGSSVGIDWSAATLSIPEWSRR